MIKTVNNIDCVGCRACEQICPQKAITMEYNKNGFMYPKIDMLLCNNCGLCEKVCICEQKIIPPQFTKIAYACINTNDNIRYRSSSGGIFYLLMDYVICEHGVVFGCEINNQMQAVHTYAENINDCKKYMTSKYIQSDTKKSYTKVKEFLEAGRIVLFSGTPCQINGLKLFLFKKYDKLICIDIICHGVPSPKVFDKYIKELEKVHKSKIKTINFRNKQNGWKNYLINIQFQNGKEYNSTIAKDNYMKLFLSNITLRESCYNCKSKNNNRLSDLTLGDFWGVENQEPQMFDNKGTSLVIVNTAKGQDIFNKISNQIKIKEVDLLSSISGNGSYDKSTSYNKNRNIFFETLDASTCDVLTKRYVKKRSIIKRAINKIKRILTSH